MRSHDITMRSHDTTMKSYDKTQVVSKTAGQWSQGTRLVIGSAVAHVLVLTVMV